MNRKSILSVLVFFTVCSGPCYSADGAFVPEPREVPHVLVPASCSPKVTKSESVAHVCLQSGRIPDLQKSSLVRAESAPAAAIKAASVASPASQGATALELVAILRNANIVSAEYPLRALTTKREAFVATKRNPAQTDEDCKIDAVLMAKVLIESFPLEILRVKVLFSDPEKGTYSQVSISKGDVASYATGQLERDDFLNSLEFTSFRENTSPFAAGVSAEAAPLSVVPGCAQDKRLMLLSRIEGMRAKGTNTKVFMDLFQKIEDAVRNGADDGKITTAVQVLDQHIQEQERMRESSNQTGVQMAVIAFQQKLGSYVATGKKLPFSISDLYKFQSLVVGGRFAEAKVLMENLQRLMK